VGLGDAIHDLLIVGIDQSGDSLWSHVYGGSLDERCFASLIVEDELIVAGSTNSYGAGQRDFWILKTTLDGDSLWSRTYGGIGDDECYDIKRSSDGGYLLVGYTRSWGSDGRDIWLLKTNASGDSLWSRTYGGSANDVGLEILEVQDSGFLIVATSTVTSEGDVDTWLLKTNSNGDSLWTTILGGDNRDVLGLAYQLEDESYILSGFTSSQGAGSYDFWLVKTEPDTISDTTTPPQFYVPDGFKLSAYPNPFNPSTTIRFDLTHPGLVKLRVFDITGRQVSTLIEESMSAGAHTAAFDGSDLASGIYFYSLQSGSHTQTNKMVLLK
jgi:hypothetical protein